MAEFKNLAVGLAKQGFAVFPLKRKKKTPIEAGGFKKATTNLETVNKYWEAHPFANIGISCGQPSGGLLVIDLDIKKELGIDGRESLKEWEAAHGSFPETVTVTTGSGGQHLYYRVHKEIRPKVGILEGVDIRCDGSYVVAPGSIHENGNPYFWDISPEDMTIADANDSVLELIEKEDARAEAEAFVMPDQIKHGGRTSTMVRLLASMQSKGLGDEAIKAAIHSENERLCQPPLTESELNREVFPALKNFPKGEMYETIPLPGSVHRGKVPDIEMMSAADLAKKKLPPITFRVEGFLADGVTMLCAKSKEGKSWLCLQMGVAVANGDDFLGHKTVKSDVLYLDYENGPNLTQDRLQKVLNGAKPPENLFFVHETERFGKGFKEQITKILDDNPNIGMIVVDVLQHIRYLKESKQSDYDCDYNTLTELKELCNDRPLAIVCVHHLRKMVNESDPFDNILGSTALMGAADETIILGRKKRTDQVFNISITGRTIEANDYQLRFDKDRHNWQMMGEYDKLLDSKDEYLRNPVVKAVKWLVNEQGEWQGTSSDLADVISREGFDSGFHGPLGEKSVGKYIAAYENQLLMFDKISHSNIRKKNQRLHLFSAFALPDEFDDEEE